MGSCLNKKLVERYLDGNSPEQERQAVEAHLAQCETCRSLIESARSHRSASAKSGSPTGGSENSSHDGSVITSDRAESSVGSVPGLSTASSDSRFGKEVPDLTFEGYQIIEELPRGGQAVVYKAIHKATKMKVALKVLLPGLHASARARRYFEQEVELAASLSHPNIVSIHDSGIAQGQYYFSMEYIHGQPLDRHLSSQTFSFREKIILFGKICDAMTHAHQRGVIHRDLKATNILVDERGEPHIVDFGLAKTAASLGVTSGSTAMPTITGQIKGTIAYMSPEQAAGRSDLIDVRTDVYTLGVILYEMLTGRLPYNVSGSGLETLQNIQYAEPARPRQLISRFDSDVEAILLKALAKDRARRYQSAAELHHDIQCWLNGLPIVAKSVSSLYLLRKVIGRHRYTTTVVGLLLLIVLGFSYVSFDLYVTAKKAQQESKNIAEGWAAGTANNLRLFKELEPLTFIYFLQAWHEGRSNDARWLAGYFADGSKARRGAMFLLHPELRTGKEADFRQSLPTESRWFADFIIAEHYSKNRSRKEALDAYRRSYQTIQKLPQDSLSILDKSLIRHIEARLYELTVLDGSIENAVESESEDENR